VCSGTRASSFRSRWRLIRSGEDSAATNWQYYQASSRPTAARYRPTPTVGTTTVRMLATACCSVLLLIWLCCPWRGGNKKIQSKRHDMQISKLEDAPNPVCDRRQYCTVRLPAFVGGWHAATLKTDASTSDVKPAVITVEDALRSKRIGALAPSVAGHACPH
jgi:hypothetical protein